MIEDSFIKKEELSTRKLHCWDVVNYNHDLFKELLGSFQEYLQQKYEQEGKIDEIKDSLEEKERRFINFLLRMLEVADFWERIIEADSTDQKTDKLRSGYKFLIDELNKIGIIDNGPCIGEFPREGKDVVEGKEEKKDLPEGSICGIIKRCYLLGDRVLRKARVIVVAKGGL